MRFDVTTTASPEQVLRALTDFSDRRPQVWRRTLDPRVYELRELGDATGARGRLLLWLLHHGPMHRVIARLWRRTLDDYADASRGGRNAPW